MRAALAVLTAWMVAAPSWAATGPALRISPERAEAALSCPSSFSHPEHEPVLLIHGTTVGPEENWGWNYKWALDRRGFDVCMVRLPDRAFNDIQLASEYVVHAIRAIHTRSGRKVDILGHSQGGLEPRWALKFWPDLREMVDDVVTLATPHHGSLQANLFAPLPCATSACLQMRIGSRFMRALNAGDETPGTISYTSIYSISDDMVQPAIIVPTAALDGATNIRVQDVCPWRYVGHAQMAVDGMVFELVLDAFTHAGGADEDRLPPGVCWQIRPPHVSGLELLSGSVSAEGGEHPVTLRPVFREPQLAPYARPRG